jgi:hypothetical protein
VNVRNLGQFVDLHGLELAGRANGDVTMSWPNGHFREMRGEGHTVLRPPDGVTLASRTLPASPMVPRTEPAPFDPLLTIGRTPAGGDVHYAFDPEGLTFTDSWAATPWTYVSFQGRAAYTDNADLPFKVTSHDWQESDRVLSAILTIVTGQTEAIEVGGRGTFDGVMTGSFKAPRISGRFGGNDLRVWGVTWGEARADLVIENHHVRIANSLISRDAGSIVADGNYALGFRADPAEEEIRSQVRLRNWPMADLRTAFNLDDWPVDGLISATDLDLRGKYRDMYGAGTMRLERGVAWKEPFGAATADLTLEGSGCGWTASRCRRTSASSMARPASTGGRGPTPSMRTAIAFPSSRSRTSDRRRPRCRASCTSRRTARRRSTILSTRSKARSRTSSSRTKASGP